MEFLFHFTRSRFGSVGAILGQVTRDPLLVGAGLGLDAPGSLAGEGGDVQARFRVRASPACRWSTADEGSAHCYTLQHVRRQLVDFDGLVAVAHQTAPASRVR